MIASAMADLMMCLLFGNILLGCLEAIVILKLRLAEAYRRDNVVLVMIVAGYFSWVGLCFPLDMLQPLWSRTTIYNAILIGAIFIIAWFFFPLILKWPFCLLAVGKGPDRLKRSLKGVLAANAASCLILFTILFLCSDFSLLTKFKPDPTVVTSAPNEATIYFLSADKTSLWSIRLNGSESQKLCDVPEDMANRSMFPRYRDGKWELVLGFQSDANGLVLQELPHEGPLWWGIEPGPEYARAYMEKAAPMSHMPGFVPLSNWKVRGTRTGLEATRDSATLSLGLDLPWLLSCHFMNPSLVPDDLLVMEIADQILLMDLNNRKIGLIARGCQPVVVLDEAVVHKEMAGESR